MATVRKRGEAYQIRVSCGMDSQGKQVIKTCTWKPEPGMTAKQTEKELQRQIVAFENKVKQGYAGENRLTFERYAEYVMQLKETKGKKHRTLDRYAEMLQRINPAIGYMKIEDIRPGHLNDFYAQLAKPGQNKKTGGRLSNKTILEHHRLISTILAQAEKEMLIPYNPASRAEPPQPQKKEVTYFQPDEIIAIRDALESEPIKWRTATHLLLITGCRRGEIMGLKWAKVDFHNNSIHIDNNLQYTAARGLYEETPKTAASVRNIKLPAETMQLLWQYRSWQARQRLASGDRWTYTDYVFTQENGKPMHPDSLTDWLGKFSKRHDLPHINPHAFRHTMASILYFNGMDSVTISKRLGHAKVSTTADIYAHIIQEADERAAECIGDVVLGHHHSAG